tara:strand:+ start:2277 stop:2777 length:501 start_codon:yes stop_codon:yes gene_type:complete
MSKLIISQIDVFTGAFGTTSPSSYVGSIKNLVIDGLQYFPEPNQTAVVDDGQTMTESYNVPIEIRTRNTSFETGTTVQDSSATTTGSANGENLLTGTNSPFMIEDSTDAKTKCFLRFVTEGTGVNDLKTGGVVLNGFLDFSNNRRETVLQGNIEVVTAATGVEQDT